MKSRYLAEANELNMKLFESLPKETQDCFPDWTLYEKLPDWLRNFKVNRETIGFDKGVHELSKINGSAVIVDKSMANTCFYENIEALKNFEGTIIACDRALPFMIEKHVIPTYVCNVDSSFLCQYFYDLPNVKKHMDKITAVFAVTTHPLTIRLWHGKRTFFTPSLGNNMITWNLACLSHTPILHAGGQVATLCWILAYNLGANPIGMLGITNSYDSLEETEFPNADHKTRETKYGKIYTDPVYEHYEKIHKYMIKQLKQSYGIITVNLSKKGVMYSPYIQDLTVKQFVEKYT